MPAVWANKAPAAPGFTLNPNAFLDETGGFDVAGFAAAVRLAVTALTLAAPAAHRLALGFTDLNLFLARLGLDYDSAAARDTAVTLTALMSAAADVRLRRFAGARRRPGPRDFAPVLCPPAARCPACARPPWRRRRPPRRLRQPPA